MQRFFSWSRALAKSGEGMATDALDDWRWDEWWLSAELVGESRTGVPGAAFDGGRDVLRVKYQCCRRCVGCYRWFHRPIFCLLGQLNVLMNNNCCDMSCIDFFGRKYFRDRFSEWCDFRGRPCVLRSYWPAWSDETSHLISIVLDHELYLKAGI